MKKLILAICLVLFLGFSSSASAVWIDENYYEYENSGSWLFTNDGNDSNTDIESLESQIESILNLNIELSFMGKRDADNNAVEGEQINVTYSEYNLDGEIDNTLDTGYSGTWAFENTDNVLNFYAVKASNEYAFYYVNPASSFGTWNTSDIGGQKIYEISHFSAYTNSTSSNQVPEPATMFILGSGLMGIGLIRRKK
ncbi:PEP-CTERM motif-containing protein [Desulfonema limicola]|uniref:PEP-CTERM motif-containing protein n=1 Tax=Desulfonema limicola TaxID=45656 RepID=A0A975GGL9_9BACT|nr:PEP-CTERM sorting domain-containing protein [Desulfonema limicola]QTA80456.1 PEP-CTERM motif-containing protein [Desulfonema limicola]